MHKFLLGRAVCAAAPFANALHPDAQAGGSADTSARAQQITRAGTQASTAGPALASMLIYLLMAIVLVVRPSGLFPAPGSR